MEAQEGDDKGPQEGNRNGEDGLNLRDILGQGRGGAGLFGWLVGRIWGGKECTPVLAGAGRDRGRWQLGLTTQEERQQGRPSVQQDLQRAFLKVK